MLINLEVYNAEISPIFDCNNLTYTVNVNNNINKLDLFTEPQEGYEVNIIGNNDLKEGENTILIEVSNSIELNTYTIKVIKETTVTNYIYDIPEPLEIQKELPQYVAPLIGIICFIFIITLYNILFHKKRSK